MKRVQTVETDKQEKLRVCSVTSNNRQYSVFSFACFSTNNINQIVSGREKVDMELDGGCLSANQDFVEKKERLVSLDMRHVTMTLSEKQGATDGRHVSLRSHPGVSWRGPLISQHQTFLNIQES